MRLNEIEERAVDEQLSSRFPSPETGMSQQKDTRVPVFIPSRRRIEDIFIGICDHNRKTRMPDEEGQNPRRRRRRRRPKP